MLVKLIRIVEDHADQICDHVMRETAGKEHLMQLRRLPESAIRSILSKTFVHFWRPCRLAGAGRTLRHLS
jgi:hypothetical protein